MKKLILKLNDCSPETLPMKRLGQYLAHLSDMLGAVEHVHFSAVSKGSAMLNVNIEDLHYQKVLTHVREVPNGMGAKKHLSAYRALQQLMDEDGTGGAILDNTEAQVLSFRKRPDDEKPLVVNKSGSVRAVCIWLVVKTKPSRFDLREPVVRLSIARPAPRWLSSSQLFCSSR